MPMISVVIPAHGPEPWLARCVDALFVQRFPTWRREIIIVDNGMAESARAIVDRQSSLRVIEEPGRGAYAARNAGIRAARGDIIAFTDADCSVAPDWLESVDHAMRDPGTELIVGSYLPARSTFAASALASYENEKNRYIFEGDDDDLYYGYTNNMAVRTRVFDRIGGFRPRIRGSDAILVRQTVERFGRDGVRFVPGMAVRHLEVRGALDYFRKVFVHSRSVRALGRVVTHRPLDPDERMDVFREVIRRNAYSSIAAARLLSLLAIGLVAWKAGRIVPWQEPSGTRHDGRPLQPVGVTGSVQRNGSTDRTAEPEGGDWKQAI